MCLLALLPAPALARPAQLAIDDFAPGALDLYFTAARDGLSWRLLAGVEFAEGRDWLSPKKEDVLATAKKMAGKAGRSDDTLLRAYTSSSSKRKKVLAARDRLDYIHGALVGKKLFPIAPKYAYHWEDSWHAPRNFDGERLHEGQDILCDFGTPIRAACEGVVERKGWNTRGGWRLGIRGGDGVYYYYAHMSTYAKNTAEGRTIKKGQVIGYVGDSGQGPEGTVGLMVPHLHFGMYTDPERNHAVDPLAFLNEWEAAKR